MGERTTIGDLTALAHKSRIPLVGVYNKDQLNGIPKNGLYIINMEDSDDGFGTHWVGLWISSNKSMRPIYFDSFGFQPPPAIVKFVKNISSRLLVNTKEIQDPLKGYCGQYCLSFGEFMSRNKSLYSQSALDAFINIFNGSKQTSEQILKLHWPNLFIQLHYIDPYNITQPSYRRTTKKDINLSHFLNKIKKN